MNSDDPAILQQEDEQDELSELMTEWEQEFWEKWREDVADDLAEYLAEKEREWLDGVRDLPKTREELRMFLDEKLYDYREEQTQGD
jgi:acetyl-CoA carboxylase carboxyltransferase component